MIRIEPELQKDKLGAQMLLQVHDELIFEVPQTKLSALSRSTARDGRVRPIRQSRCTCRFSSSARAADNWDEAH